MALLSENIEKAELDMKENVTSSFRNQSSTVIELGYSSLHLILTATVLTIIMIVIVFGNLLVVIAIHSDRNLKSKQNWFIASLSVADFLLGLLIMPFSLANELMGYWYFGSVWCDLWKAIDVLLCTASILSICLISLDRYWSITKAIQYARKRTSTRAAIMITAVWVLSAIICVPPLIGWKNPLPVTEYPLCLLSEDIGYVIYSTMGSFYIPAVIMVFVYYKIYLAAKKRARRHSKKKPDKKKRPNQKMDATNKNERKNNSIPIRKAAPQVTNTMSTLELSDDESKWPMYQKQSTGTDERMNLLCLPVEEGTNDNKCLSENDANETALEKASVPMLINDLNSNEKAESDDIGKNKCIRDIKDNNGNGNTSGGRENDSISPCDVVDDGLTTEVNVNDETEASNISLPDKLNGSFAKQNKTITDLEKHKRQLAKARERRATIVLGLVMAAFILCWFPFFTLYIITSFCYCIPNSVFTVAFWAGYCNSALNPIIYTVFNRDFRNAFKRILLGKLICRQ